MGMTLEEKRKLAADIAEAKLTAEAEMAKLASTNEDVTASSMFEAFKAGAAKSATAEFGDELAAAGTDLTEEERIAANEEIDSLINKNIPNAIASFVGGIVPSVVGGVANVGVKTAAKLGSISLGKEIGKLTAKKALGLSMASGALEGAGSGNTLQERAVGAGIGALTGLGLAGGTYAAGTAGKALADTTSASKMTGAIEDLTREIAVEEQRKAALNSTISKFNTGYPLLDDEIRSLNKQKVAARKVGDTATVAEIETKLKPLNALKEQKRPELATKTEKLAEKETAKDAVFTKRGVRAAMTDEELNAASDVLEAAKAAESKSAIIVPPKRSVEPYAAEANKRLYPRTKGKAGNVPAKSATSFEDIDVNAEQAAIDQALQRSAVTGKQNPISAAVKKEGSEKYFNQRRFYNEHIDDAEVRDILKNKNHPLLVEPKIAAANASEGYKAAVNEWRPNKTDDSVTGDHLLLLNNDLAPIDRNKLVIDRKKIPASVQGKEYAAASRYYDPEFAAPKSDVSKYVGKSRLGDDSAYGKAYTVIDRNGNPRVAKIATIKTDHMIKAAEHEKDVARSLQNIRANATPLERDLYLSHFPNFEQIIDHPANSKAYIFVMDEYRPLDPLELSELFYGRESLRAALKKIGFKRVPGDLIPGEPDFRLPRSYNVQASSPMGENLRRPLHSEDYENMSPRVSRFIKALEYMSDVKNFKWEDLHYNNVMVDPKTNEFIALDLGRFKNQGKKAPGPEADSAKDKQMQEAAAFLGAEARAISEAEYKTTIRARAAGEDIKALPPDEMARRFTRPTGSVGSMAAERGFPENEAGQLQMWSNQSMASKDVANPTEAYIKRLTSNFSDVGMEPNWRQRTDMIEHNIAQAEIRIPRRIAQASRLPAGPKKEALVQEIEQMTSSLEDLRDELRMRSTENAEQLSFDFPEAGGKNIAEQLARRDIAAYRARNPQGMVRIPFFGNKSKPQRELPSAGSTTGGTAMIPVGSKDIIKRAKGPGIIARAGKALRGATDKLNLGEFRSERDILESEYDFYNYKLHKATTEPEIRAAERELALASYDLDVHKGRYPDTQDFEAEVKEINDAQANGIYVERRKMQLMDRIIETFRKYPEMYDELDENNPVRVAWDTW